MSEEVVRKNEGKEREGEDDKGKEKEERQEEKNEWETKKEGGVLSPACLEFLVAASNIEVKYFFFFCE